ncbi:MAG: hypothetical protein OXB90_07210 [Acidimicrobiaceae bacterium]|nr:hypothetical protein [Acidimicrobiaceae bacterium]
MGALRVGEAVDQAADLQICLHRAIRLNDRSPDRVDTLGEILEGPAFLAIRTCGGLQ